MTIQEFHGAETLEDMQDYLERYPLGNFAAIAERVSGSVQAGQPVDWQAEFEKFRAAVTAYGVVMDADQFADGI